MEAVGATRAQKIPQKGHLVFVLMSRTKADQEGQHFAVY